MTQLYTIEVESYEGDADSWASKTVFNLIKEDVKFFFILLSNFGYGNPYSGKALSGRDGVFDTDIVKAVRDAALAVPGISTDVIKMLEECERDAVGSAGNVGEVLAETLNELVLHYAMSEYLNNFPMYFRTVSNIAVYKQAGFTARITRDEFEKD